MFGFCLHAYDERMEWILSQITFNYNQKRKGEKNMHVAFPLVHFDTADSPIVPGSVFTDSDVEKLVECQDLLGSVLWLEAIQLFLPFLCRDLSFLSERILCLGEGTGAVGCGLHAAKIGTEIFVSDLPQLLPLLEVNARLNIGVRPVAIDWTRPLDVSFARSFNVVVGCEVLYGNRSVWESLLSTIQSALKPSGVVYICVTLRNARLDLEDFIASYLNRLCASIEEIPLSDSVSVIKAVVLSCD